MNIIWLFLGALAVSIGWYTGRCIVHRLDDAVMNAIGNSKIVKAYRKKKHENKRTNSGKHGRYHETKMGF